MKQEKEKLSGAPISAEEQKDPEKQLKTTTSHSRFGMNELEMSALIRRAYKEHILMRGIKFSPFHDMLENAIDIIARFLVMDTGFSGILIYGKPGTGKTSLIKAIETVMEKISLSIPINDNLRVGFANPSQNISRRILEHHGGNLEKVNLLLLDDIGLEHMTERSNSITLNPKDAIVYRYDYSLPTIMASIFDQISLGEIYGQRLMDCIQERYMIIELEHNYRQENIRAIEPIV